MDPIEESVRRALEGGDPADGAFRRSIYAASIRAMERLIQSRGADEAEAQAERERVDAILSHVEAEYSAYYGGDGVSPAFDEAAGEPDPARPAPEPDRAAPEPARPATAGAARTPASFAPPAESEAPAGSEGGEEAATDLWQPGAARGPTRRRPGRNVLLGLLFLLVVALLLALGAFLLTPDGTSGPQTSVETPEAVSAQAPPTGPSWIDVFSGTSLEQVSTPDGGRVTSVVDAGRPAIRVSAPDGGEGEILINLGPGLVGTIAGSQVRVELVAGSPDGTLREFSVRCLFAQASVCERQRFATSMPEEAFVFDVPIPASASTPANLAIGPGLSAAGPDVDVFSVRMRVL